MVNVVIEDKKVIGEEGLDLRKPVQPPKADFIGLDIGTSYIVAAYRIDKKDAYRSIRSAYLAIEDKPTFRKHLKRSGISHIKLRDKLYLVGDSARDYAVMFNAELGRPMQRGVLVPGAVEEIDVMRVLIGEVVGDQPNSTVVFSCPAAPADGSLDTRYHEETMKRILLDDLKIKSVHSMNEAHALAYSELSDSGFTGISFSYGAGMCNVCLSGDTKIPLLNGEIKTIKELSENYADKEFWVYSCKEDGTIVPGKARLPRKTGFKKVVRVSLDNNKFFDCTEDHKILLRDGSYIEAGKLLSGDSLMPLYLEKQRESMPGYLLYYHNKHHYWEMVHSMVAREIKGVKRKKGFVIHHKDINKINNSPDNLVQLSRSEHNQFHKKVLSNYLAFIKGKKLVDIVGEERAKIIVEKRKEWRKDSVKLKKWLLGIKKGHETNRLIREGKSFDDIFGEVLSKEMREKMSKARKGKTFEEIYGEELAVALKKQRSEIATRQEFGKYERTEEIKEKQKSSYFKRGFTPWNKGLKGDEYIQHYKEGIKNQYSNHKVAKIEFLGRYEDVYDLTVDEHHNFALDCGVFVHNCLVHGGMSVLTFSIPRGGDWIDEMSARSRGTTAAYMQAFKEEGVSLVKSSKKTPSEVADEDALRIYYKDLISTSINTFIESVKKNSKNIPMVREPIPLVIAGGTSLAGGFVDFFKSILDSKGFPFPISKIKYALEPLTSVARGLMIAAMDYEEE